MKTLRTYGDGYGSRVVIQHGEGNGGYLYIVNETPGQPKQSTTFLPQEIEELASIIRKVAENNRDAGVYPYKGKTMVIGGMTVQVREPEKKP